MSELIANCPRCHSQKMTFDLENQVPVSMEYNWQIWLEVFCICRNCQKPTIFLVAQKNLADTKYIEEGLSKLSCSANQVVEVKRHIGIQDNSADEPPEYLPENIERVFEEGAACMAIGCHNAAATMFRLCLDMATQSLLPEDGEGLNNRIRRSLGLRLIWLFEQGVLPNTLQELSTCIKDDGNDGAHEGILGEEDAADILDFTYILLERLFTEPKRLEVASERRAARRERT